MNINWTLLLKILLPLFALSCLTYSFIVISNSIGASDEELTDFTNAVAMNNNESISPSIHIFGKEIPYVNSPYMGSMKSWVVAPILKNFGASINLIRFSNVIFGIIYLFCFYWALRIIVGDAIALLVFLMPVWDTKFLLYTPTDYGPFLFQLIFIVLSIGGIARFYKNKNTKWWFFANLMIGAVLYQKFTSLPIFLTLLLTNNLIYLKFNIDSLFSIRVARDILLSVACVLLPLTPYLYYLYNVGTSDFFSITSDPEKINLFTYFPKLNYVFTYFLNSFDGAHYARGLILVKGIKPEFAIFGYFSLVTIMIASVLYFTKKVKDINFSLILSIFLIGLYVFVSIRGLVRDHHYLVLNPLWISLFIISFYMVSQYFNEKYNNRWIPAIIFIFIPSLFMFNNSRVLLNNISEYKGAALSSMAIYDVAKELELLGAKKVYGLNFSISSQMYLLSNGDIKGENLTWTTLTADKLNYYVGKVKKNKDSYLVARRSTNYDWSEDWMEYLNRDAEISDLINNPKKYGVKITTFLDERRTLFFIIK